MQIIRPVLNATLLVRQTCLHSASSTILIFLQKSAKDMLEQERIANEEAEKRLKAALTAKREPNTAASRTASPAVGTSGSPDVEPKTSTGTETEMPMDVDGLTAAPSPKDEVSKQLSFVFLNLSSLQSPWVPELEALFEDVKVIAPGNAYDVIGCDSILFLCQIDHNVIILLCLL